MIGTKPSVLFGAYQLLAQPRGHCCYLLAVLPSSVVRHACTMLALCYATVQRRLLVLRTASSSKAPSLSLSRKTKAKASSLSDPFRSSGYTNIVFTTSLWSIDTVIVFLALTTEASGLSISKIAPGSERNGIFASVAQTSSRHYPYASGHCRYCFGRDTLHSTRILCPYEQNCVSVVIPLAFAIVTNQCCCWSSIPFLTAGFD